eukprot:9178765-Pyramimonas_sp.AAC.2
MSTAHNTGCSLKSVHSAGHAKQLVPSRKREEAQNYICFWETIWNEHIFTIAAQCPECLLGSSGWPD